MPRKSLTDRRAEKLARLVSIRKKFASIESKAGERLGKLSLRAGPGELNLDDDTLLKEFEALGGRFRQRPNGTHAEPQSDPAPPPAPPAVPA